MRKNNLIAAGTAKSKVAASQKTKVAGKTAKSKSSNWYQGAIRSIAITKERSLKSGMTFLNKRPFIDR
jgi:hypothetical protein